MTTLNRFTCEEAFRRIDDYLDRELQPSEMRLVQEHLEICEGCAREFRFEASVISGVKRKLRQIELPGDLQARVLAALEREGHGEG
jgi:anti-sigma factor (TIGR02949 family)